MTQSNELQFNPFEDRLSRDLRNDLSEGFAHLIETGSSENLDATVTHYRMQFNSQSCYADYLNARTTSYQKAVEEIKELGSIPPVQQAIVLWNHKLFFEMHEVLEHAWYDAIEPEKQILQALIRSAGVYIKSEYGFNDSAERIAAKARPVLLEHQQQLNTLFDVEKLLKALQSPLEEPPTLEISQAYP